MTVQVGLCQTWSETTLLVFPRGGSYFIRNDQLCKIFYLLKVSCLMFSDFIRHLAWDGNASVCIRSQSRATFYILYNCQDWKLRETKEWTIYQYGQVYCLLHRSQIHLNLFISCMVHYSMDLDITWTIYGPKMVILNLFCHISIHFTRYNTDWIADTDIVLDPYYNVQRMWCIQLPTLHLYKICG